MHLSGKFAGKVKVFPSESSEKPLISTSSSAEPGSALKSPPTINGFLSLSASLKSIFTDSIRSASVREKWVEAAKKRRNSTISSTLASSRPGSGTSLTESGFSADSIATPYFPFPSFIAGAKTTCIPVSLPSSIAWSTPPVLAVALSTSCNITISGLSLLITAAVLTRLCACSIPLPTRMLYDIIRISESAPPHWPAARAPLPQR